MEQRDGPVVAISGASSGIGLETARHLATLGATVVVGARRFERIELFARQMREANCSVKAHALDVRDPDSFEAFVAATVSDFGRIDVLINNAGVMPLSSFRALRIDDWNYTIDVNIRGVLHGIAAALPRMKRQGNGHFVNIASIGAHRTFPGAGVYCASKFAVWALSDALRQEEIEGDIRVTTISPGTTTSELADHITDAQAVEAMRSFRSITIDANAVARAIAFAIAQPKDVDVSEIVVRPTRSPA
jgi:NADP-dependent 3-hydroxy acid dehydrogenase YdfG